MPIGVIAKLSIQPGKNAEFESVFGKLAAEVNSRESGCHFYALHQSRIDPQSYVVLEQYSDEEALALHGKTDYFRSAGAELAPCMAAAPEIEYFDAV
ncbi:MAG: putative quinol monooxygenase [Halieaceae bacterium]|jgi:quinol monooxygenase YgiN|nr:putative quinol monooxygenase [Halieaceae bacterium]